MTFQDVMAILTGPQTRLAVWLPVAGVLTWACLIRWCQVRCARTRFWSLLAVVLLAPMVFVVVIGGFLLLRDDGGSAARTWLTNHAIGQLPRGEPVSVWHLRLLLWPYLVIPLGMLGALSLGALEYLVTSLRIGRLRKRREGRVMVLKCPGLHAFTFGLVRPQVFVSEAVWVGAHREAVLAHEFAHVARFDPLLFFWVRAIRRSTLYLPLGGWLFDRVSLEAERACDQAGVRAVGVKRYAAALLAFAEDAGPVRWRSSAGPGALAFGLPEATWLLLLVPVLQVWGARLRTGLIVRRLEALLQPESPERLVLFWVGFVVVYGLILSWI